MNRTILIVTLFCIVCTACGSPNDKSADEHIRRVRGTRRLVGGASEEKPATATVSRLVDSLEDEIKNSVAQKTGSNIGSRPIKTISYTSQVVAGTNYFVKIMMEVDGKPQIFHVRIYKGFSGQSQLNAVTEAKRDYEPIEYFS